MELARDGFFTHAHTYSYNFYGLWNSLCCGDESHIRGWVVQV